MEAPSCRSRDSHCVKLSYQGESYLENSYIGVCVECGTMIHGHKSNWRITAENGKVVLLARGDSVKAPGRKHGELSRVKKPKIVIEVSKIQGLDFEETCKLLRQLGVNITSGESDDA